MVVQFRCDNLSAFLIYELDKCIENKAVEAVYDFSEGASFFTAVKIVRTVFMKICIQESKTPFSRWIWPQNKVADRDQSHPQINHYFRDEHHRSRRQSCCYILLRCSAADLNVALSHGKFDWDVRSTVLTTKPQKCPKGMFSPLFF